MLHYRPIKLLLDAINCKHQPGALWSLHVFSSQRALVSPSMFYIRNIVKHCTWLIPAKRKYVLCHYLCTSAISRSCWESWVFRAKISCWNCLIFSGSMPCELIWAARSFSTSAFSSGVKHKQHVGRFQVHSVHLLPSTGRSAVHFPLNKTYTQSMKLKGYSGQG